MNSYVEKHHPLLTSCIEFTLVPAPAPSSIAPCIKFTDARLAYSDRNDAQTLEKASLSPPPELPRRNPNKIMKPPGKPSRPKSGGFSVEEALKAEGWAKEDIEALTEAVCQAVREELDITQSYHRQNKAALKKICDDMMKDTMWPRLKDYESCWPVQSILKLALKYATEAAKHIAYKGDSQHLQAALRGNSLVTGGR